MSGARSRSRTSSRREQPPAAHDPWWGSEGDEATGAYAGVFAPDAPEAAVRARPRARRTATRQVPFLVSLLSAPFVLLAARARRSAWMRRLGVRAAIVGCVLLVIAGSVGVILLNNTVIARTAELGRLDDSRRELRRENALLGAEAARRSAPPVVQRRARTDLGMDQSPTMPIYIYLELNSRTLTPAQRLAVAARERARRGRLAGVPAASAATTSSATPATGTKDQGKP